jgi:pimeloyl-ACP methyl ester carboxylesterase
MSARLMPVPAVVDATSDAVAPEQRDPAWEPPIPGRRRVLKTWNEYMAVASNLIGRFHGEYQLRHFDYCHPPRLQPGTIRRLKRSYRVSVAYTEWGPPEAPLLVCCGGVASVAMRFNYLASDLCAHFRVVCMDWVGRGRSGWLASEGDYSMATYVEQLRQLLDHLDCRSGAVLGSSLGGSVAIELAAREPRRIDRLILNDIGPMVAARRRRRRADTLARHYVFRDPSDMLRRIGASQKNDGPVSDDVRFNVTFHQTRWSDEEGGRVYRHDVRALQAYRREAQQTLQQWPQWEKVHCPILVIHGLQSDVLSRSTIRRMARGKDLALMQVPTPGIPPCWRIETRPRSFATGCWTAPSAGVNGPCSTPWRASDTRACP